MCRNEFEPAVRLVDNLEALDLVLCEGRVGVYAEDDDSEVVGIVARTGDYQVSLMLCKNNVDNDKLAEMTYRLPEPSTECSDEEYYNELVSLWDMMRRLYGGEWTFFLPNIGVYVPSGAPALTRMAWEAENRI